MSVATVLPALTSSYDTNRRPSDSSMQGNYHGTSNGATPESDLSEDAPISSPENDAWLTLAYAKHRMIVSLMRDVHAIFNSQWRIEFRSRTGSQPASTEADPRHSSSSTPSSVERGKRRKRDRESHSPDPNDTKKKRTNSPTSGHGSRQRLLACCFYKNNPQKYCSNGDTGTKYRSCAGPGFSRISQLK